MIENFNFLNSSENITINDLFLSVAFNSIYYIVIFLKFYRVLCLTKLTFDGLPMINPYVWPFSVFRVLTQPYFTFCEKIMPNVRLGKSSFEISTLLGLQGLSSAIDFLNRYLRPILYMQIQNREEELKNLKKLTSQIDFNLENLNSIVTLVVDNCSSHAIYEENF